MMDLAGLFRVWNPQYKSWSVFGQDHLAKVLLNWDTGVGGHDAGAGSGGRAQGAGVRAGWRELAAWRDGEEAQEP